ncbi:uncharacterized protein A4U43_C01F8010 [Asparagus officinalis]|uniref:Uncharacterized protein n=1 Tax=Asparagus officinalis TaxID=4686 RepID=A0A5P1FRJ7_ASPOF|nr:uncharacterized protein A4U43_C01F8010 [Asparagus officinalis]
MTEAMIRKKPGMASVREMPVLQDGPPPGGFAPARYARRIPTSRIHGRSRRFLLGHVPGRQGQQDPQLKCRFDSIMVDLVVVVVHEGLFLKDVKALKEEKYAARRAILPMLQAEEDERQAP